MNCLPGMPALKVVLMELLITDADAVGNALCVKEVFTISVTNQESTFDTQSPKIASPNVHC